MTDTIELSEKLAKLYGVDADNRQPLGTYYHKWLAEDSGRISDLADENDIQITPYPIYGEVKHSVLANQLYNIDGDNVEVIELYKTHATKHAAARMARVRCLIAIGELT